MIIVNYNAIYFLFISDDSLVILQKVMKIWKIKVFLYIIEFSFASQGHFQEYSLIINMYLFDFFNFDI